MDFDLKCFFVGDAAVDAAVEDGHPTAGSDGVENDYWVRNDSTTLRSVLMSSGAEIYCVARDPNDATKPVPCSRSEAGVEFDVWLRVADGQIDRVVEQFAP